MKTIYDYSECDEVADNMPKTLKRLSFDDALSIVKTDMPEETITILDNIAEALMLRSWREHPKK